MKESWSLFTVKKHWVQPTLLDFNDWLEEKAEAHDLMKQSATKARPEDNSTSVTKSKTTSNVFASNSQQGKQRSKCHLLLQTLTLAALYAKVTTGVSSFQGKDSNLES